MRTYRCGSCEGSIVVGHPGAAFRRQALGLLRSSASLLTRIFRRGQRLQRLTSAMEEKFYEAPFRYRELPRACPRCGFRGGGDLPWWRPGVSDSSG